MTTVSVILPCYNRAPYLGRSIASVLRQTFADFQLIVVDDGSTDGTPGVVEGFSDARIEYLYAPRRGVSAARNLGLSRSSGEYIAFLDDDDFFLPDKLRVQVRALERNLAIGLIAGGYLVVDQEGQVTGTDEPWTRLSALTAETLLLGNRFSTNAVLVRRAWWDRVGGFDERLSLAEDWDAWLRLALAGCRMAWTRDIVCGVRQHNSNASLQLDRMTACESRVLQKAWAHADLPPGLLSLRAQATAQVYLRSAARRYAAGALSCAGTELERAIGFDSGVVGRGAAELLEAIATRASQRSVGDPRRFVDEAFRGLPRAAAPLQQHRAAVLAKVALARMFRSYRAGNWRGARDAAIEAFHLAPSYLRNRGALKVALLSTLHTLLR